MLNWEREGINWCASDSSVYGPKNNLFFRLNFCCILFSFSFSFFIFDLHKPANKVFKILCPKCCLGFRLARHTSYVFFHFACTFSRQTRRCIWTSETCPDSVPSVRFHPLITVRIFLHEFECFRFDSGTDLPLTVRQPPNTSTDSCKEKVVFINDGT